METDFFLKGLIWVANSLGTTLIGRNHAVASDSDQGLVAVWVASNVVLVTDNHIHAAQSWSSLVINAQQGLCTDNLTTTEIINAPASLKIDPNPVIH